MTAVLTGGRPAGLDQALVAAGLAAGVATARRVGPAAETLSRWVVTTTGGDNLWVDIPGQRWRQDEVPSSVPPELRAACRNAGDDQAGASLRVALPGLGWACRTPWPADVLARPVLDAALAGVTADVRLDEVCRATGAFLRRLHEQPVPAGVRGRRPPPLARLTAPPEGSVVTTDPRWRQVAGAFEPPRGQLSLLHGQLGLAHLLVAAVPPPGSAPVVCLTGWTDAVVGTPAFDIGHVMGDFLEVAALFGSPGGAPLPGLFQAALALRSGYEQAAQRPLEPGFWAHAARAACVKVLDHDVRRLRAFSESAIPAPVLQRVAGALLDPETGIGSAFR